jgi:arylsulfatase A-like enzyme
MLYEGPVTIPLIVSWRGVTPAGGVDKSHLVSGLDVLPTMCDYVGIPPREDFEGLSLRPLIDDPARPGREFVVTELQPDDRDPTKKGRMLRTRRYKYVAFSHGARREMLFDLEQDPGEMNNLCSEPSAQDVLARHRALLHRWITRHGDEFETPS